MDLAPIRSLEQDLGVLINGKRIPDEPPLMSRPWTRNMNKTGPLTSTRQILTSLGHHSGKDGAKKIEYNLQAKDQRL